LFIHLLFFIMSSTLNRAVYKAAFTHIMENILQNSNSTSALAEEGIEDTFIFFALIYANVKTIHLSKRVKV
jgi:hypothetical protein